MRKERDSTRARRNPVPRRLKKPITLRLDEDVVAYFKRLAEHVDLPYQFLINLYLRDCMLRRRHLRMAWLPRKSGAE